MRALLIASMFLVQVAQAQIGGPTTTGTRTGVATPSDTTPPGAPTLDSAIPASLQVTLNWTAPPDVDVAGYNVYWDTANPPVANSQDVGLVLTYVVGSLTNDQLYYFAVDAYDEVPNTGSKSNVLSATPSAGSSFSELLNPTGQPIGGYIGYTDVITGCTTGNCHVVAGATNAARVADLKSYMAGGGNEAISGDTVFIDGTWDLDLSGNTWPVLSVPGGVILASNRGENLGGGNYSKGARLYVTDQHVATGVSNGMITTVGDDVRITGLRLDGMDYSLHNDTYRDDYYNGQPYGILVENDGYLIDNLEVYGFATMGIRLNPTPNSETSCGTVRHVLLHDNHTNGWGYGVWVATYGELCGGQIMRGIRSWQNRHNIASTSRLDTDWVLENSIIHGGGFGHFVDRHDKGSCDCPGSCTANPTTCCANNPGLPSASKYAGGSATLRRSWFVSGRAYTGTEIPYGFDVSHTATDTVRLENSWLGATSLTGAVEFRDTCNRASLGVNHNVVDDAPYSSQFSQSGNNYSGANQSPPDAVLSTDTFIEAGATITLDMTGSSDPDGHSITWYYIHDGYGVANYHKGITDYQEGSAPTRQYVEPGMYTASPYPVNSYGVIPHADSVRLATADAVRIYAYPTTGDYWLSFWVTSNEHRSGRIRKGAAIDGTVVWSVDTADVDSGWTHVSVDVTSAITPNSTGIEIAFYDSTAVQITPTSNDRNYWLLDGVKLFGGDLESGCDDGETGPSYRTTGGSNQTSDQGWFPVDGIVSCKTNWSSSPVSAGNKNEMYWGSVASGPARVANLVAATGGASGEIDLTWDAATGATDYTIYRAANSGRGFAAVAISETCSPNCSVTDTGLTPATTYYYKVSATNSNSVEGMPANQQSALSGS